MRRLIQQDTVVADPICDPFHNLCRPYLWTAKKSVGFGCIAQKSGWAFFKLENWLYTEVSSELLGNVPHRESLGASHIQNESRGLAVSERTEANGVRVSLPNHVYKSHPQINGPALEHCLTYVGEYSVTKFNRVIQAQECDRRAPAM